MALPFVSGELLLLDMEMSPPEVMPPLSSPETVQRGVSQLANKETRTLMQSETVLAIRTVLQGQLMVMT